MVKILVVDDEYAYRNSLCVLLGCEGFEVRAAQNAQEAYNIVQGFVPDLLVVDWILQDQVDGFHVAKALESVNPQMQVIVITGYPTARLKARMKDFPSAQCLEKPFQAGDIIATARAIEGRG